MRRSPRRALPGVLASLLLAAPLMAVPAHAQVAPLDTSAGQVRKSTPSPERRPLPGRAARPGLRQQAAGRKRGDTTTASVTFFDDAGAWHQNGLATWYGGARWRGRMTASGTRFDDAAMTAAHASLPLGSRVRVTLVGSDRSVEVTVNDRPGTRNIAIDLSRAAAQALGIMQRGVAMVSLSTP